MFKKFLFLGIFLVAGFLFINNANAAWTWTGGGDATTWTDRSNWGATCAGCYPGATSTGDGVTVSAITNATTIYATSTLYGLGNITLQSGTGGSPTLVIGNGKTFNASTSVILISATSTLKGGDATWGSGTLWLGNGANNATPLSIGGTATFTAATGTVTFAGALNGAKPGNTVLIATTTYYTLNITPTSTLANITFDVATSSAVTIGAGGGTFSAGATFAIASEATLTNNGTITATGATWANSGTVTQEAGASIINAAESVQFTDSSGTSISSVSADGNGSIYLTVTDPNQNFLPSIESLTATITAKSLISSGAQTVTLTETSASSGIFRGGLTFTLSGTAVTGALAYQGGGTFNYSWVDAQDATDASSCTGCATFTGTAPGGGGSGGSSSATTVTTTTTTTTTDTTTATTATPAPATATVTTPSVTTSATVTLDSVQSKVASVIAKIAQLTKNSSPAEVKSAQDDILAILNDITAIQAAQPTPQGVALGFNFVRPLALGLRDADVSKLQEALKTDPTIYPEGLVTGYFGSATMKAVQRFQEKYGIASSGASGYGNVGPKTRAKLNELFGNK